MVLQLLDAQFILLVGKYSENTKERERGKKVRVSSYCHQINKSVFVIRK
jgi:hypothetical protein